MLIGLFVLLNIYNSSAQNKSRDLSIPRQEWKTSDKKVHISFANSYERYAKEQVPLVQEQKEWSVSAWRGEKIHTQILIWADKDIEEIKVNVSDFKTSQGTVIAKENITTGFVDYVMTDEFKDGCGYRKSVDFDSSLVADPINTSIKSVSLKGKTVQPVWLSIRVPAMAKAGTYKGKISVYAGNTHQLDVSLTVLDKNLPAAPEWDFNLDLWQHPAAIARIHHVALWSDAHFEWMKKYYTMLAGAGQKNITASIVNEPWGHQTYDDYPSLIKWTKKKSGEWSYDYSLFDKYISFVMSCGIKERINCYSMVPWKIAFTYYDEMLQKDTVFTEAIGTPAYNMFWHPMLQDFTKHLKEKKWFTITAIAMDERPMAAMQSVIQLLKKIDTNWKIALAGDYHPEIENDIFDYCVASRWQFPADVLQKRKQQGKISTWYTCCTENYPNGFTFSPPDEHVWLGWYTAATGMDGYLRWAFNSWPKNPLKDSRFTAWPAGDTYQVYPGPLTSIRFEKLIEGVQDFEKIRLLRNEYKKNNKTDKLKELDAILNTFTIPSLSSKTAAEMVNAAKQILNN